MLCSTWEFTQDFVKCTITLNKLTFLNYSINYINSSLIEFQNPIFPTKYFTQHKNTYFE